MSKQNDIDTITITGVEDNLSVKSINSKINEVKVQEDFADKILKNFAVSVKKFPKIIFNFNTKTLHKAEGDRVDVSVKVKIPANTCYHDFYAAYNMLCNAISDRNIADTFNYYSKNPSVDVVEGYDPFSVYSNAYMVCNELRSEGTMIDPCSIKIVIPGAVFWNGYEWVISYVLLTEILDFVLSSADLVRVG